jgi:hypothetical protein
MPLLRGRRDDGGTKYRMREKLFSIGDDYWIENEEDERAFKVDGEALRVRDTLVLEDTSGAELFSVQEKKLRVRDTMEVERDGPTVATIKKAMITPLRDRSPSGLTTGRTWRRKGTSSTTSTRSSAAGTKWPKSRSAGSGSGTPTGSRSPRARTTRSCFR